MDPLDFLFGLEKIGIKFGLDAVSAVCESLGNPQNAFQSVIVAGTNGKGSVTAMVEESLRLSGARSARYTSPHLVRLEERFFVGGCPTSRLSLIESAGLVRDRIADLLARGRLAASPTFFEATTAIAFDIFRRAGIDIAVIEVGLGGRFDATNIVTPSAAAITSIDLDHEALLGHSIPEIAFEKAGVIKEAIPVVVGETKEEAVAVIERVCRSRGARLIRATADTCASYDMRDGRPVLALDTPMRRYDRIHLALRGRHQVRNAIVAVRLMEELEAAGVRVGPEAIRAGLESVQWPGRLDLVALDPERQVLLDAAHNPAGAATVAAYVGEHWPEGLPLVFGAMRDKDATRMLETLAAHASCIVTTQPGNPRAIGAGALAQLASRLRVRGTVEACRDPVQALERAWQHGPVVLATGSIFLVGELLAKFRPPWSECGSYG